MVQQWAPNPDILTVLSYSVLECESTVTYRLGSLVVKRPASHGVNPGSNPGPVILCTSTQSTYIGYEVNSFTSGKIYALTIQLPSRDCLYRILQFLPLLRADKVSGKTQQRLHRGNIRACQQWSQLRN